MPGGNKKVAHNTFLLPPGIKGLKTPIFQNILSRLFLVLFTTSTKLRIISCNIRNYQKQIYLQAKPDVFWEICNCLKEIFFTENLLMVVLLWCSILASNNISSNIFQNFHRTSRPVKGSSIKYIRKIFQKTNFSLTLLHTSRRKYKGVRNIVFF